jgi:hypothetical protein
VRQLRRAQNKHRLEGLRGDEQDTAWAGHKSFPFRLPHVAVPLVNGHLDSRAQIFKPPELIVYERLERIASL